MTTVRQVCLAALLALGLSACAETQSQATSATEGHLLAAQDSWQRVTSTPWRLDRLAGAPLIEGSEITLNFGDEPRISGSGGANNYFAGVERTGGEGLKVTPVGATQMYRADPPGVMEQEGAYFKQLQVVDQYRLQGGRLQLLSDDQVVLEFQAASE